MSDRFVSCELEDIQVDLPLPVNLYIYLDFRFITYRSGGDKLDRILYDRLVFKKVRNLFIQEKDFQKFSDWKKSLQREREESEPPPTQQHRDVGLVRSDTARKMLDIFQSDHPDKYVSQVIDSSRKIVDEIMKFPFAVKPLSILQGYSQGTVDHSVNVSILSVYLSIQMGYSHQVILQHIALGSLMHDIGKAKVPILDSDTPVDVERKMRDHPTLGLAVFEDKEKIPNEVRLIIAQHHENHDGSGFPKGLRGGNIYDLARIVSIANVFDELVGAGSGTLVQRQREAIKQLDEKLFRKFDPIKLEKSLKVLKLGI